jgi:hypothetical protein
MDGVGIGNGPIVPGYPEFRIFESSRMEGSYAGSK